MTMKNDLSRPLSLASLLLLGIALAVPVVLSQSATPPPSPPATPSSPAPGTTDAVPKIEFDVATFKLNNSGDPDRALSVPADGDGFTAKNRPIHDLIRYAFSKGRGGAYRISGQPDWVDSDRYDIQAKVSPDDLPKWKKLSPSGKRLALQGFVIEYFKLKYHQDMTPHPYYALTVAKNGPKMKAATPDDTFKGPDGQVVKGAALNFTGPFELTGQNCNMERLSDLFSGYADRGVLDKTGLTGTYTFVLHYDPIPDPRVPDGQGVPLFAAKPEEATPIIISAAKQLGLEIKPATGPMDGMVIDHIERPPED